jgi:hypothetical protein
LREARVDSTAAGIGTVTGEVRPDTDSEMKFSDPDVIDTDTVPLTSAAAPEDDTEDTDTSAFTNSPYVTDCGNVTCN